jgi:glyoxalase family protein
MKLDGLHHITMITGDARRNVAFHGDLLGLRLVKQTVDVDAPETYHLYFGDETGAPGSLLTWLEFRGARRGHAGGGMVHTIQLGVSSLAALGFWRARLRAAGHGSELVDATLRFADYDGLTFELVVTGLANPALTARHPDIPPEYAILGPQGARAYAADPAGMSPLLTAALGFTGLGDGEFRLLGEHRQFAWAYDPAPRERGEPGAGTVHHIAWAARDEHHLAWREQVRQAGSPVTDVHDRGYFRSISFREPRGVLFEIATLSPGVAADEDADHLGEELRLPRRHEHRRAQLVRTLMPIVNPRFRRQPVEA